MRVGITGSNGFIGKHLTLAVKNLEDCEVIYFDRDFFRNTTKMDSFVSTCDLIVHSAAVIKNTDEDIYGSNIELTNKLTAAMNRTAAKPTIIFLSTTQRTSNTDYGRGKKGAEDILKKMSADKQIPVSVLILPGVFGEGQRPFYNSVVSTFCTQIVKKEQSAVNTGSIIELIHVRHVVNTCLDIINKKQRPIFEEINIEGNSIAVEDLYNVLNTFSTYTESGNIPKVTKTFEVDMFNTFRYYAYVERGIGKFKLLKHEDDRGCLFEILRTSTQGQILFSTSKAGVTRGGHYHTRKIERFCIVKGCARIRLKNLITGEKNEILVDGNKPTAVDIPNYHLHTLINLGDQQMEGIFWLNEHFDPDDPDTFQLPHHDLDLV